MTPNHQQAADPKCACAGRDEYKHFTQHGPYLCGSPESGSYLAMAISSPPAASPEQASDKCVRCGYDIDYPTQTCMTDGALCEAEQAKELPPLDGDGSNDWRWNDTMRANIREAQLREVMAERDTLKADMAAMKRKLAIIFDQSCYGDSLGVEGSSFTVCRWCGGGSGPGGNPGFKHNYGCLLDDGALEEKVASVWEELPELEKELAAKEAKIAELEKAIETINCNATENYAAAANRTHAIEDEQTQTRTEYFEVQEKLRAVSEALEKMPRDRTDSETLGEILGSIRAIVEGK